MDLFQATLLGFIQGVTEFLPISSSAHLILPSVLFNWNDQGLTFDVALHLGSLIAVLIYFRLDIRVLVLAGMKRAVGNDKSSDGKLAWLIVMATLPGAIAGFFLDDLVEQYARSLIVLATTTIFFALMLLYSDKVGLRSKLLNNLSWKDAAYIGVAQAVSLIPGTSRSGITMTAALLLGYDRKSATKLSFFLAIPIILGSTILRFSELLSEVTNYSELSFVFYGALVAGITAYGCIHIFLQLVERIGFLPFVIYRIVLAVVLFAVYVSA
ncbi:MAG: undecaprenyl-diphosphate phosphatase [Gammaproteobacteria bacterium]|nr:undecaprenyl-diphosphate phosphatase [Gammaproteobacteria bacterium]